MFKLLGPQTRRVFLCLGRDGSLSRAWGVLTVKIAPQGVGGFAFEFLIPSQAILNPAFPTFAVSGPTKRDWSTPWLPNCSCPSIFDALATQIDRFADVEKLRSTKNGRIPKATH